MATAVMGGAISSNAIMNVQLAVTCPFSSGHSQRKGRTSVKRQQAAKMARMAG